MPRGTRKPKPILLQLSLEWGESPYSNHEIDSWKAGEIREVSPEQAAYLTEHFPTYFAPPKSQKE